MHIRGTPSRVDLDPPITPMSQPPSLSHITLEPNGDLLLRVKVVPGSSRDALAGMLGERLKVKVAAAPEAGKANAAVCSLIASTLGIKDRDVTIESGHTAPEKTLRISGVDQTTAQQMLT